MKRILILVTALIPLFAKTQKQNLQFMKESNEFLNDVSGSPIHLKSDYNIEGTPFFSNEYCLANLKVRNGRKYTGVEVKLNLQDNAVIYRMQDGQDMLATTPLETIEFITCLDGGPPKLFQAGYPGIDRQSDQTFYQVLDSGFATLLKYYKISFRDEKPYSSASVTRIYQEVPVYYAYIPANGMSRLGNTIEPLLKLFPDNKEKIVYYFKTHDLQLRREGDLRKLFAFSNTLKK